MGKLTSTTRLKMSLGRRRLRNWEATLLVLGRASLSFSWIMETEGLSKPRQRSGGGSLTPGLRGTTRPASILTGRWKMKSNAPYAVRSNTHHEHNLNTFWSLYCILYLYLTFV